MFELLVGVAVVAALVALARASRALAEIAHLRREVDAKVDAAMSELSRASRRETPPLGPVGPAVPVPAPPGPPVTPPVATPPLKVAPPVPVEIPRPAAAPTAPPIGVPPVVILHAPAAMAEEAPEESLEARIGSRWLLYLGVGAIVIAAAYFVKLAFDNQWITETMRVVIGAVAGLALVWAGGRFARSGYPLYGQMLAGGGVAILYLSVYAAFNFYALIGRTPAFGLMVVVTGLAAWLADGHRSQGLALAAVGGGFFTPFLIGGDTDAQAALFGYDAILVAGTAFLSRRRDWPGLNLLSYWMTLVTIVGWFARFYTDAAYLRTVLFLTLFCALFGYILARSWRSEHPLARVVSLVMGTAPLAYYAVSIVLLFSHALAFLVYLVAITLAGLVIARRANSAWGRVWLWAAVAWPLAAWAATRATPPWLIGGVTVALAVYALHLVTQLDLWRREEHDLGAADVILLHANGLGLFALLYLLFEDRGAGWLAAAAAALAIGNVGLAAGTTRLRRELTLHFGGIGATLATIAVALWTDGAWTILGLSVEAAALVAVGLRTGREWLRLCGGLALGLATLWFMGLEFQPAPATYTVVLNSRTATAIVLMALFYALTMLHRRETGGLAARAQQDSDYFLLALNAVLFAAATTEINAFWELRGAGRPIALSRMASLTIAWTLQAIGVIRVGLSRRRDWLRAVGALLLFVPVMWATTWFWGDVLSRTRPPEGYVVLVNARAAAAMVIIIALYGLAAMHHRARAALQDGGALEIALAILAASVVTLGLLSAESSAFWYLRDAAGGDPRRAFHFARELTLSVLWAGYAAALVAIGIQRRYRPIRYFAIGLFIVTVLKVAFIDLAQLERLYRVLSAMALGILMLLASYLYQRYRTRLIGEQ